MSFRVQVNRPRRAAAALVAALAIGAGPEPPSQLTTFSFYSPLASNAVLAERLQTPLAAVALADRLAANGERLRGEPIDLDRERFRVVVPRQAPPDGYGLLVFIPPWTDNHVPPGWASALDRDGVIFVSPTGAGNDASPLVRREPLAILAAVNAMQRYPINPERVYVGGFSGGSRIALHLALAYPDLFRGALLDAGADPIGGDGLPLPSRELFDRFRLSSRIVLVTGAQDEANLSLASEAALSLHRWCVANVVTRTPPGLEHEVAPAPTVAWALAELDKAPPPSPAWASACWSKVGFDVQAGLDRVAVTLTKGDRDGGERELAGIDHRYGGLAAPESVALARRLAERR